MVSAINGSQGTGSYSYGISTDGRTEPSRERAQQVLEGRLGGQVRAGMVEVLIEDAFGLITDPFLKDDDQNLVTGCFFCLSRRWKRHFSGGGQGMGQVLAPVALVFIEVLSRVRELPVTEVDWSDEEDVMIAFESIWNKVKFAEGQDLLEEACDSAREYPCVFLGGKLGRVISTAYHIQAANGGKSFMLPINDKTAACFGITKQQLGRYVQVAVERRFFRIVKPYVACKKATVYRFDTSHPELIPAYRRSHP